MFHLVLLIGGHLEVNLHTKPAVPFILSQLCNIKIPLYMFLAKITVRFYNMIKPERQSKKGTNLYSANNLLPFPTYPLQTLQVVSHFQAPSWTFLGGH